MSDRPTPAAPEDLTGRIGTSTSQRGDISVGISGRIGTSTSQRGDISGILSSVNISTAASGGGDFTGTLSGRIGTSTSHRGDISGGISGALVGRVSSTASITSELTSAVPLELVGSISTTSSVRGYVMEPLSGRVHTSTRATAYTGSGVPVLLGNINTAALVTGNPTNTVFAGVIKTTVNATVDFRDPQILIGNIRSTTVALLLTSPQVPVFEGIIYTRSSGSLTPDRFVTVAIKTTTTVVADLLEYHVFLEGVINTTATAVLTPAVDILSGHISTASFANLLPLPILPDVLPPYCPIPAILNDYLDLITSEHKPRPNYIASVTASVDPLVEDQAVASSMPCLFDLDISVGEQEDYVGQWIGKTRYVHLGNVFFSFDTRGLGWDQANWRGPFDPENAIATLDDYHYRLLLYSAVVANSWDGSIPEAYRAWDILFAGTGYRVLIQDNGNMTMMLGLMGTGAIDAVTAALFQNGDMDLKPEGISLNYYVFQAEPNVPFFAWDSVSDSVAGWDLGYWGYLVPPGEGYVPEAVRMRG